MIPQNDKDIIIYDTVTKESVFLVKDDKSEHLLLKYNSPNEDNKYVTLQIGDTVEFQDFATISDKRISGVIKKVGWSIGPGGPYITCGIKVENVEFGTALPFNYTKSPISLTKVKS